MQLKLRSMNKCLYITTIVLLFIQIEQITIDSLNESVAFTKTNQFSFHMCVDMEIQTILHVLSFDTQM